MKNSSAVNQLGPRETDPAHCNGYPPYPEALVISSPRSGLNLIRHFVEHVANLRTPGKTHLLSQGSLAFHRSHSISPEYIVPGRAPLYDIKGQPLYKRVMLLLRDPREILPRAYKNNLNQMGEYCSNLQAFHDFTGDKLLVFYDDLINDDTIFQHIFTFLGIDHKILPEQVADIRADSVEWYQTNQLKGGGSQTKGSPDALRQHQQQLTDDQLRQLRDFLDAQLGTLVPQYLGRWLD